MQRKRVLVVDDDHGCRSALAKLLELDGFTVETAESGQEALASISHAAPDAVITDVDMPRMDGVELTARLSEMSLEIPVVLVSAVSGRRCVAGVEAGAAGYFLKPVDYEMLLSELRRLLSPETDRSRAA